MGAPRPKTWAPCQAPAIRQQKKVNPVASGRKPRRSRSQLRRTMSTPPPRGGQTAADRTGRRAGRDQAAPGRYGTARHAAGGPSQRRHGRVNPEDTSVVRSSGVMALGTLASRGTGFLRTLVLAYTLGVGAVSTAYYNANTLPNAVYDLMLGGILTSVVVPLLDRKSVV